MHVHPHLIKFSKIGSSQLGYISVAEKETLPITVKRVYWTYYTPEEVERGGHAHYKQEQIMIAMAGRIIVKTEMPDGKTERFILDTPDTGLFIPKMCWREMQYSHTSVQVCLANMEFQVEDYIRDYDQFKKLK